jgi:hypothetical protein
MRPGIPGLALGLAILAAAPAAWAADAPPTASAAAEAGCRKAADPSDADDIRQARYIGCMTDALAFDPGLYFRTEDDTDNVNAPGGIVDARHSGGRAGPSWSFAIDRSCPRSIAPRPGDGSTPAIKAYLAATLDWREADIRTCPNAARTLLSLERARWFAFDDWDRASIVGGQAELVVPGDGPGAVVRARGLAGNFVSQDWSDEGAASAWAKRMMEVVGPCLKPSPAPAPWDRP